MATKIIISRKSEFINRARGFRIFIDGKEERKISNGGTEEFHIEPGSHELFLKIDWCSSPELGFTIKEGETKFFLAESGMKYYSAGMILLVISFLIGPALKLMNIARPENLSLYQFVLLLPVLFYMMYYMTLGRKKYIHIEEDTNNIFQ